VPGGPSRPERAGRLARRTPDRVFGAGDDKRDIWVLDLERGLVLSDRRCGERFLAPLVADAVVFYRSGSRRDYGARMLAAVVAEFVARAELALPDSRTADRGPGGPPDRTSTQSLACQVNSPLSHAELTRSNYRFTISARLSQQRDGEKEIRRCPAGTGLRWQASVEWGQSDVGPG
jgi:hypothetical protein